MSSEWKEMWSVDTGGSRNSCGIAQTEDGFAVDVLRGDTCIASEIYSTLAEAERAAAACKRRFARRRVPPPESTGASEMSIGV